MQQDFDLRLARKTQAAAQPPQLLDVKRRQPVVDAERRGRRAKRRASDEKLDAAARDNALDQLADFGLVLAPGARQIQLELEKALIERAHLRRDANFSAFDFRPSKAGHA